ncbi:unnamed protein product (plasmid) [Mycetohabitans rhizoxinica HKI 454]|uniref:Uncharacterized protein n=1 Tax=Mycetohabitans rhizoxinica (strain DSM 19002 / CIP 109453 / HKI 454) TaxID=882378 RepID=E5AVL2_MYCRK|nr:unnamed protein product [Mycetohabitans rhizoxinica HKI 454]
MLLRHSVCSPNVLDNVFSFDCVSGLSTSPLHLRLRLTIPCHRAVAYINKGEGFRDL